MNRSFCMILINSAVLMDFVVFFFKQKTAYELRISDWSSDVCSSDLARGRPRPEDRARWRGMLRLASRPLGLPMIAFGAAIMLLTASPAGADPCEIGRASCRERVCPSV